MHHLFALFLSISMLASCSSLEEPDISADTVAQLTGVWQNASQSGSFHFYSDETVKLSFPKHQPPIKLISSYQIVKDKKIGIALGGFWSGPILIDITHLKENSMIVTFPDDEPVTFTRQ